MNNPLIAAIAVLVVVSGLSGCNPRMTGAVMQGMSEGIAEQNRRKAEARREYEELRRAYVRSCALHGTHCDKI